MSPLSQSFDSIKNSMTAAIFAVSMATPAAAETARAPEHVEAHDIFIIDASNSMPDWKIEAAFEGVRQYYTSDEAMINYRSGLCTAATVVYFGDDPETQLTQIICSRQDAEKFVADNVDPQDIQVVRTLVGGSTILFSAVKAAGNVYRETNITASRRRVAILGDDVGAGEDSVRGASNSLSYNFGATVSVISLEISEVTRQAYQQYAVTPKGAKHRTTTWNGVEHERPIAPGLLFYASDAEEISEHLKTALSLGGF